MSWNPAEEAEAPRMTRTVQVLLGINVVVAFLAATVVQPSELSSLFAFRRGPIGEVWWTAFTYMFLHAGLLHLAFNLYTLWVFGPRVEHLWGGRAFALFYLWCGIGGAVFHALFGGLAPMVGASAAVFGVMTAYAMHWPRDEIYLFGVIPMRVATMVAIFVGFDLVRGLSGGGGIAYFAHVGGVVFALLYIKRPQQVSMENLRQRVSSAPDVGDDMSPRPASRPSARSRHRDESDDVVAQSKAAVGKPSPRMGQGKSTEMPRETRVEELDRVLDKISRHGMASLTAAEKRLLEEMSKQLRDPG